MEAPLGTNPALAAPTTVGVGELVVGKGVGGLEEDLKMWVSIRGNPGERDTLTRNDRGHSSRTCHYST